VITYVDTSVLVKLLVEDEIGGEAAERLWLDSDYLVCADIGYAEARAALASAHRSGRLEDLALGVAKAELEVLWDQIDVVSVTAVLVRAAADLAEAENLRAYDAVHLAAAIAAQATVVSTADAQLLDAARRRHFDVSNPLEPLAPSDDDR
jgi:uncharacterized protein